MELIMTDKTCSLLFLIDGDRILLAMKKRGFGMNRFNGIGGKVEIGETMDEALVRECQEEILVTPTHWWKVAEHDFIMDTDTNKSWHLFVHTYLCDQWEGEPSETDEMAPEWFEISTIPYERMWQDDQYWLPLVLAGDKLKTVFEFNQHEEMLSHRIETIKDL